MLIFRNFCSIFVLWTTRCIPLKCPWWQNLARRIIWTRYLCCNLKKHIWNRSKRQKSEYLKFHQFLVFWPTRCVPAPDPKLCLRHLISSVAYLEAFWPKKLIYYPEIVKEQWVQAPHRNAYFRAFWPTWRIGAQAEYWFSAKMSTIFGISTQKMSKNNLLGPKCNTLLRYKL